MSSFYILRVRMSELDYYRLIHLCQFKGLDKSMLVRQLIFDEWLRYQKLT